MRIIIFKKSTKTNLSKQSKTKKIFFLKESVLSLKKMQHDTINEPANGTSTKANY